MDVPTGTVSLISLSQCVIGGSAQEKALDSAEMNRIIRVDDKSTNEPPKKSDQGDMDVDKHDTDSNSAMDVDQQ